MGVLNWLFGRRKQKIILHSSAPDNNISNPAEGLEEAQGDAIELSKEEHNLLTALGIDELTGLQLKAQTQNKLEGLFRRFLADEREPEPRGIRSAYQGKEVPITKLNNLRTASDIHFFECGGYAGDKNDYIAVVKTPDMYDILRIMETDGTNYDVSTEDVVTFLKRWETKIPFFITQCEADTLVITLNGDNVDLLEMVKEAVVICPDLTGGDDSPEEFEKLMALCRKSQEIYFWWD